MSLYVDNLIHSRIRTCNKTIIYNSGNIAYMYGKHHAYVTVLQNE